MLKIRKFVEGEDEEDWLRIYNEAFREYDDFRPLTMEDMEIRQKSPNFDTTGMFIAEWNSKPVGKVNAFVEKQRKEKKGFVKSLGVLPEFRRRGIGKMLVNKAIHSLRERGMESVETWTREDRIDCKNLFESMSFKLIRVFSIMRREIERLASNIKEHKEVRIRQMSNNLEDIILLNWLENETFKEHFDFRPSTIEETKYFIENKPWCDIAEFFVAYLDDKPVGYVGAGVDSKFIQHKGIKRGWILAIGVLKPFRRKRIGTALMLHSMQFLKSKGMTDVELDVDDKNPTKAVELYEKVGFEIIRKELTYLRKID